MKVRGRIYGWKGQYTVDLDISRSWSKLESDIYKTEKAARSAAERLAKKLGLEIVWEGEK